MSELSWERVGDRILSILRGCFTPALFVSGAYLIDTRTQVYLGLLLVGWSFARMSTYTQRVYGLPLGATVVDVAAETRSNTKIEIWMKIDAILGHPAVASVFDRLRKLERVPQDTSLDAWRESLIARFRTREKLSVDNQPWAKVVFEVRAGQLWTNGEYRPLPVLFHQVLVPDEAFLNRHAWGTTEDAQYHGLKVRVGVLNGILRLQVGEWDEDASQREPGQTRDWMAWDTITTFPLLLNPLDHYLPPRFLLLDYFTFPHHRKGWRRAKAAFFRQADEYRRIVSTFGEWGEGRLYERQTAEFKRWIHKEGFKQWGSDRAYKRWNNDFLGVNTFNLQVEHETYKWLSEEGEKVY